MFLLLFIFCFWIQKTALESWSYEDHNGPAMWSGICANGNDQSPINLNSNSAIFKTFSSFEFSKNYKDDQHSILLKNNGHTLVIIYDSPTLTITGGGLGSVYTLAQLHLHWGDNDLIGSEHSFSKSFSSMEIHHVHYDSNRFKCFNEALNSTNGIAVLGTMVEIGTSDNPYFATITNSLDNIKKTDSNVTLNSVNAYKLLSSNVDEYYRYNGSLTTPNCDQAVIWTVFRTKIIISEKQINSLRSILSIENNFRPIQAVNNRQVLKTFSISSTINKIQIINSIGITFFLLSTINI